MDGGDTDLDIIARSLTLEDLPALVRIDEHITGRTRRQWFEGKLERALSESDIQISLGAEMDGMLVGAMLGSMHYGEFGQPEPIAVLDTVLVDREFSGRGIASVLLEQFTKNLHALRIERIRTEVSWDDEELVSFFRKKGFVPLPRLVLEVEVEALIE